MSCSYLQEVPLSTLVGLATSPPESESKEGNVIDLAEIVSDIFAGNDDFRPEDYLYRGESSKRPFRQ